MIVYTSASKPVNLGMELYRGGEGAIYPVQTPEGLVAKIYAPGPPSGYDAKLAWMKANPPVDPMRATGHAAIAWPLDLLYTPTGKLTGYLMPHIKNTVPLLSVFNPRTRARTLPGFDWKYLHRTARNLAYALAALHGRGYIVGDLNESNILITPTALVTMIDTDSFQVTAQGSLATGGSTNGRAAPAMTYPCPVGKPEYTPPELQGKTFRGLVRLPEHDGFGLGVLVFQLLMEGSHPFRAQWLSDGDPPSIEERIAKGWFPYGKSPSGPVAPPPNGFVLQILHPGLMNLVQRCFVTGHRSPKLRPTPEEWAEAISEAEHALVKCSNGHFVSGHLAACPRCGAPMPAARTAAKPVSVAKQPPAQPHAPTPSSPSPNPQPLTPSPQPPAPITQPPTGQLQTTWQTLRSRMTRPALTAAPAASFQLRSALGAAAQSLRDVGTQLERSATWLWGGWLLATLLGWIAGALAGAAARPLLGDFAGDVVQGALIGIAQWLVLHYRIDEAGWWVPATALGYGLGAAADRALGLLYVGPVAALLSGSAQAVLLWRRVRQGPWWVLASAGGWTITYASITLLHAGLLVFVQVLLAGVTNGIVSGVALIWLMWLPPRLVPGMLPRGLRLRLAEWRAAVGVLGLVMLAVAGASISLRPCGWLDTSLKLSKCIRTLAQPNPVWGIAFSPDGSVLAAESLDHTVRLWRTGNGELLPLLTSRVENAAPDMGANLLFANNGATLLSLAADAVLTWRTAGDVVPHAQKLAVPATHSPTEVISSARFSPDGALVAQGVCDRTNQPPDHPQRCDSAEVRLWRVSTGEFLAALKGYVGQVQSMTFSRDGNLLATGSCKTFEPGGQTQADQCTAGEILVWRVHEGKLLYRVQAHSDWVSALAFSNDGSWLASGSTDGIVEIWGATSGIALHGFQHSAPIKTLTFTRDDATVVAGSNPLAMWSMADNTPLGIAGLSGAVSQVAVSPDGTLLAAVNAENQVILWQLR